MMVKNEIAQPVLFLLPVMIAAGSCQCMKDEPEKPNIIFMLTDDQAWNILGREGRYEFMHTPNLDQLAGESMVFRNAYVTISLCSPSRACYLTGCYPHVNGVYINESTDPDTAIPMVQKALQEAGYETAFVGKWHMKRGSEPRDGFDYWLSFDGQGQYINPELNENGRNFREKGYITDILTEYALRWIRKPREKPFCLFLWHKAIHAPFTPAPRDSAAFADISIPEYDNWYDTMEKKPEWLRRGWLYGVHNKVWHESEGKPVPEKINPRPWNPKEPRLLNYFRTMLAVDQSVGYVRKCLEELNILDKTVLVFSSDNGYFIGAHQKGDKRLMYEESIRIPLMIRYPGKAKQGRTSDHIVLNIDVAPTLIDIAGGTIPGIMQGRSMMPLLDGREGTQWRKSFLYTYFREEYAPGIVTMVGVRNDRYKYIHYPELINDIDELYDLSEDPGEMNNLIGDTDYKLVLDTMKTELETLMTETGYFIPEKR